MTNTPNWFSGQRVQTADMTLLNGSLRSLAAGLRILTGNQNAVWPGGFALGAAAGSPIVVNVGAGEVWILGYDFQPGSGSVTLANGDPTNHRYDLLIYQYSQATLTDSAGNPYASDIVTLTVTQGLASGSPVVPSLPTNAVQVGWVDVTPGATSATSCVLHGVAAPLAPNNLSDLTTHLLTSLLTGVVHGVQATLPGGTGADQLALTDAAGGVGKANGMGYTALGAASSIDPNTRGAGGANGLIFFASNGPSAGGGAFIEYFPPTVGNTANQLGITSTTTVPLDELGIGAKEVSFRANPYNTRVIVIRTDGLAGDPGAPGLRAGDVGLVSLFINPTAGGNIYLAWDVPGTVNIGGALNLQNPGTTTTAPAAGGAGALPATPAGYVTMEIAGVARKVAYY